MTRLALTPGGTVAHRIGLDEISNDLADWIAEDLIAPGLLDRSGFERTFVSVVRSVAPDPTLAWAAFYRNTLRELDAGGAADPAYRGGTNAGMAPVHLRAAELAVGDVVELGCCFGFLSLRLAAAGHRVTAVDLSPGTVALLAAVAPAIGVSLCPVAGDALAVPLADRCADTVFAVHLLEHLPPAAGIRVLAEMLRLARRRVVVAVPYEDEPNPNWGHVRTFDSAALHALGTATGHRYEVSVHHGGWLVLDL